MKKGNVLLDALRDEDRLLRRLVAKWPRQAREIPGPAGSLSCKDTLGHIAYWDDFAVRFFLSRVDPTSRELPPPAEFEARSHAELQRLGALPFGEVFARYLESTGALLDFLAEHWEDLSERERHDFWVPLKHRRHHRHSLLQILALPEVGGEAASGETSLAAGA